MNILTKYIVIEILKASLVSILVLLTLYNLFTFADEMGDLGKGGGGYGLGHIVQYLLLTTPGAMYELMPSAALLASLVVLGSMANSHELVAMRVATFSLMAIVKAVVLAGVILIIISTCISEFVVPVAERTAQVMKAQAQKKEVLLHSNSRYGFWLRDENTFINVRQMPGNGELADISLYELDEQRSVRIVKHAKRATYVKPNHWLLKDVVQTQITEGKTIASKFKQLDWKTGMDPGFLDVVVVRSETLSLVDLYTYIQFLKGNGQKSKPFELAFWSRLADPLVIVMMLLVAVPIVIKAHREMSIGFRILLGTVFGVGFHLFDKIIGHVGLVYGYEPMLMGLLPSMAISIVAVSVISKLR
jgi:lipopolysaccharide export system permease protein